MNQSVLYYNITNFVLVLERSKVDSILYCVYFRTTPTPYNTPAYHFYGLLDDIRIYKRALSDSEIKVLYDATK
jgi:hypothetical protein